MSSRFRESEIIRKAKTTNFRGDGGQGVKGREWLPWGAPEAAVAKAKVRRRLLTRAKKRVRKRVRERGMLEPVSAIKVKVSI